MLINTIAGQVRNLLPATSLELSGRLDYPILSIQKALSHLKVRGEVVRSEKRLGLYYRWDLK